jgi:pseudaminic acid synthase
MTNKIFETVTSTKSTSPVIIVEMSGNHGNDIAVARTFVKQAITAGADIIKFQVYTPDTITLNAKGEDFQVHNDTIWNKHKTLYELYSLAHTPWDWIAALAKQCDEAKQPWFASPFDATAVDFLESINCPAYKLASPEINDINLIEVMAKTGKPIILSTGLATKSEIDVVVEVLKKHHNNFAILKCTSAYPAPLGDLNLNTIPYLCERYKCAVGYSDHSEGDIAAIAAVALGASVIEKHFKLDDDDTSVDTQFSMNISNLPNFKKKLLDAHDATGQVSFEVPPSAQPSLSGRRSLYVSKAIKSGELFSTDNIKSVRPAFGLEPKFLPNILGKHAAIDLQPGDRLTLEAVKNFDAVLNKSN